MTLIKSPGWPVLDLCQTIFMSFHTSCSKKTQTESQQKTKYVGVCKTYWQESGRGEKGRASGTSRPLWPQGKEFFEGHKAKLRGMEAIASKKFLPCKHECIFSISIIAVQFIRHSSETIWQKLPRFHLLYFAHCKMGSQRNQKYPGPTWFPSYGRGSEYWVLRELKACRNEGEELGAIHTFIST